MALVRSLRWHSVKKENSPLGLVADKHRLGDSSIEVADRYFHLPEQQVAPPEGMHCTAAQGWDNAVVTEGTHCTAVQGCENALLEQRLSGHSAAADHWAPGFWGCDRHHVLAFVVFVSAWLICSWSKYNLPRW